MRQRCESNVERAPVTGLFPRVPGGLSSRAQCDYSLYLFANQQRVQPPITVGNLPCIPSRGCFDTAVNAIQEGVDDCIALCDTELCEESLNAPACLANQDTAHDRFVLRRILPN